MVNFMARMHSEDIKVYATLNITAFHTKIKSFIGTYSVAMNTAVYTTIIAVIIWSEAISVLDYTVYGRLRMVRSPRGAYSTYIITYCLLIIPLDLLYLNRFEYQSLTTIMSED